MKILHLTLKKRWFDMVQSGKKKEDYRTVKPYWDVRLVKKYTHIKFTNGYSKESPTFLIKLKEILKGHGRVEWGAPPEDVVYVLRLGSIVK